MFLPIQRKFSILDFRFWILPQPRITQITRIKKKSIILITVYLFCKPISGLDTIFTFPHFPISTLIKDHARNTKD
jgi:hypothetical protein